MDRRSGSRADCPSSAGPLVSGPLRIAQIDRRAVSADILHLPARVVVTTADVASADARNVFEELSGVSERLMIVRMTTPARPQQRYDHRLRDLVQHTGDVTIATDLGVPRSTARGWLRQAPTVVVGLDLTTLRTSELQQEILELRRRVRKLTALLRLALALLRSSGFTLTHERLPDGRAKIRILRAVDRARECDCPRVASMHGDSCSTRVRLTISPPSRTCRPID